MNEQVSIYCKVIFHYENVPQFMRKSMERWFIDNRHGAVLIYNKYIGLVNNDWDSTGERASFGEYLEDINPKYVKFVQDRIQPHIDLFNRQFLIYRYKVDDYGDLVGYIPFIKGSKLWITLKKI